MLRRLTDLWPRLVRAANQDDTELTEPLLSQEQGEVDGQVQDHVDEH